MPKTSFYNCNTPSCHFKKYRFQMDAHVACRTPTHTHTHPHAQQLKCAPGKYTNRRFVRKSVFRLKNISLSLTESQFEWKDLCDLKPTILPPVPVSLLLLLFLCSAWARMQMNLHIVVLVKLAVPGKKSTTTKKNLHFHFPTDVDVAAQWAAAAGVSSRCRQKMRSSCSRARPLRDNQWLDCPSPLSCRPRWSKQNAIHLGMAEIWARRRSKSVSI